MSRQRRMIRILFLSMGMLFSIALASCTITVPYPVISLTPTNTPTPTPTPTAAVLPPVTVVPNPIPGPSIRLVYPAAGLQITQGQALVVQSTAAAAAGVNRIELWMDGALYATVTNPRPRLNAMAAAQTWSTTALGNHTLAVIA